VVFNIKANDYRLIVVVQYVRDLVGLRSVPTGDAARAYPRVSGLLVDWRRQNMRLPKRGAEEGETRFVAQPFRDRAD
jgi:hypothetical protein